MSEHTVVFPPPELPTKAIFLPTGIVKEIPYVFLEYDLSYDRLVSKNTQYYYTTQNKPKNGRPVKTI